MMKLDKTKITSQPNNNIGKVAKLQENIEEQLRAIKMMNNEILKKEDIFKIEEILNATSLLINDCHITSEFRTSKYENFALLCYEYQRLLLKFESYQIKENLENEKIKLNEDINKANDKVKETYEELENLEKDQKSLIATILGIVLAISIIPTAIAGIEHISPSYVLPFLSTIVLFGMIMIAFVYSIYQRKLEWSTVIILMLFIVLTGTLWLSSWNIDISLTPKSSTSQTDKTEFTVESSGSLN